MRWWREWCKPELKCQRVGHAWTIRWRRGFTDDDHSVHEVEQERVACRRCGELRADCDWETIDSTRIDTLSGPSEMFRTMRREGFYQTEDGWRALGAEASK